MFALTQTDKTGAAPAAIFKTKAASARIRRRTFLRLHTGVSEVPPQSSRMRTLWRAAGRTGQVPQGERGKAHPKRRDSENAVSAAPPQGTFSLCGEYPDHETCPDHGAMVRLCEQAAKKIYPTRIFPASERSMARRPSRMPRYGQKPQRAAGRDAQVLEVPLVSLVGKDLRHGQRLADRRDRQRHVPSFDRIDLPTQTGYHFPAAFVNRCEENSGKHFWRGFFCGSFCDFFRDFFRDIFCGSFCAAKFAARSPVRGAFPFLRRIFPSRQARRPCGGIRSPRGALAAKRSIPKRERGPRNGPQPSVCFNTAVCASCRPFYGW